MFRTLIRRAPPWLLPLAVLAIGLGITAAAVRVSAADLEAREQARFSREAEALKAEVSRRLERAVSGLSGLRAMYAATGTIATPQLRRYVERRDMAREFPGLRGFGVIERVRRADLADFQQRQRDVGYEGFTIRTAGSEPEMFVVRSVEPLARNRAALGFDSGSNPIAREALEHAVESGITTMTAPLVLRQDESGGLGWVLYMPVYRGEPRSVDQRHDSLAAIVFAPLPAAELLASVPDEAAVNADFRLYDDGNGRRLVFDAAPAKAPAGQREIWQPLLVGDRVLVLQVLSRPELTAGQGQGMPWLIGLVGAALAAGLGLLTWRLAAGGQVAVEHAERRLEAREHLLRTITDNLPARISYWNHERRCLFANRRFREFYGVQAGIFDGPGWLRTPADPSAGSPEQVAAVLRGEPQRFEQEVETADGRTTWQVHYIPDGPAGAVKGFFVLAHEITELRQARDVAIEASTAKTRFLSSMSHEIRTPMNAILGMLTLLRGTRLDERQDDYADKAEGAARSLLSLLNDVLDFSKIEAGRMQLDRHPFSLEKMLADLSVILSANVGDKDVEVLYDLDPEVPDALVGDDMRLRQILINLGGNAVKFTPAGEVVLRTRLLAREDGNATIEFAVTDTGIGISEAEQHGLFDDYVQASDATARQFGGTGLGLSICRRLTELMGSQLHLASTPGEGSCFSFALTLPIAADAPADGEGPACGLQRVLVVDDNPVARLTLAGLARTLRWPVDTVGSGDEAVARVAAAVEEGAPYDLVLLDWRMPGLDGWQASERIRAAVARPPMLVMVTGQGRETLGARPAQERAQVDAFLVKPVTPSILRETVERLQRGAPEPAATAPQAAEPGRPLAGVRLLLVEDNPINQQIAGELLASQGAQVEVAGDGQAALDRLHAGPAVDAVLMDMLMPVMDGLAATRAIRAEPAFAGLPVIAMTANAMDADRAACIAAGMDDHLGKPIVLGQVVAVILRHVRRRSDGAAALDDQPSGPVAAAPVLDRATAVARLGGDASLFERLLPVFRKNLHQSRNDLQAELATEELCRLVHTLKSTAGAMGASTLAASAQRAETSIRCGAPAQAHLGEVTEAIDEALREVDGLLAQAR